MSPGRVASVVAVALVASCASPQSPSPASGATTTTTSGTAATEPERTTADASTASPTPSTDETHELLAALLSEQLCPRLRGAYIGLPGDGDAVGPTAGLVASAGRWWIRTCDATVGNGRIALHLAGPGWTWIDQQASGFRVQQYVLFDADVRLGADVSIGYDAARRVASVWMTPEGGVAAHVQPLGVVHAVAQGFFASVVGGLATLTGASPSERATASAGDLGAAQMRTRLAAGFTMTYALATHQVDFMVGRLDRGDQPQRPFAAIESGAWTVNARSVLHPGGVDVIGPIDVSNPVAIDVALEEGPGVALRSACANDLATYFDLRFRVPDMPAPMPPGRALVTVTDSEVHRVALPPGTCPVVILATSVSGNELPVRLRYRVAPPAMTDVPPPAPRRIRVTIVSVSVAPHTPNGHDWDVVGGAVDPYVVVASLPQGREIDRTPVASDRNEAVYQRVVPGTLNVVTDFPLRLTVFDRDETSDELVGTGDLPISALPPISGDVSIPMRSADAVPVQTATVRLHVETAQ